MSYEYDAYYPPTEYAQPHADPYFIHPNSAATQLGLTQEEVKEVLEEQERWDREFQQELEEEERARISTPHHRPTRCRTNPLKTPCRHTTTARSIPS
jgi:hypothetical protein